RREDRKGLARVLVVTGTLAQADYDIATAEAAFREAIAFDPDELSVAEPLIDLLIGLRRYNDAVRVVEELLARKPPPETRAAAHYKLAAIWSDCLMDPAQAAAALRELLRLHPRDREGYYRLAQEQYRWAGSPMPRRPCTC